MQKKRTKKELVYCNGLRLLWRRSPMYWEAMNRTKQSSNQYKCEGCGQIFKLREIQNDHIKPVIDPIEGWKDVATFAARLNCASSELSPLCEDNCHRKKTNAENKERK